MRARRSLRARFIAFDDALARHGVPPLTAWWREGIGAWLDGYETGGPMELDACVGRGAAKSTALYKLATFFALFGAFAVPPGERHFAIILSRLKEEAAKGLSIIDRWLSLLGVPHHVAGDVIELDEYPRGLRVVAASVAATSGWRAFFVGKDERSKWPENGVDEMEGAEIDTSAAAMTATHARAPNVAFGSAWTMTGPFYDAVTGGTNEHRVVLGPTPTWIAAPHINEASTRAKERDERRWRREYACVFQPGASGAFDADAVERAFKPRPVGLLGPRVLVLDPSSGRADAWTWATAGWVTPPDGRPFFALQEVDGLEGKFFEQMRGDQVVARLAALARSRGITTVVSDQRESLMLAAEFARHDLSFCPFTWTGGDRALATGYKQPKSAAVAHVRRWFANGDLSLPTHAKLRAELLGFEERLDPSGAITFGARGKQHDDFVALLITAAMADRAGLTPCSVADGGAMRGASASPGARFYEIY